MGDALPPDVRARLVSRLARVLLEGVRREIAEGALDAPPANDIAAPATPAARVRSRP